MLTTISPTTEASLCIRKRRRKREELQRSERSLFEDVFFSFFVIFSVGWRHLKGDDEDWAEDLCVRRSMDGKSWKVLSSNRKEIFRQLSGLGRRAHFDLSKRSVLQKCCIESERLPGWFVVIDLNESSDMEGDICLQFKNDDIYLIYQGFSHTRKYVVLI